MKTSIAISVLLVSAISANAHAQCDSGQVIGTLLTLALSDKVVCAYKLPADNPNTRWSEHHMIGGTLREWARGPDDPVDPSHNVGSWSVNELTSTVVYTYSGTPGNPYRLHANGGGTYSLCGADGDATVTSLAAATGDNPCGWNR